MTCWLDVNGAARLRIPSERTARVKFAKRLNELRDWFDCSVEEDRQTLFDSLLGKVPVLNRCGDYEEVYSDPPGSYVEFRISYHNDTGWGSASNLNDLRTALNEYVIADGAFTEECDNGGEYCWVMGPTAEYRGNLLSDYNLQGIFDRISELNESDRAKLLDKLQALAGDEKPMNLCDRGHEEVCFEGRHCPACMILEEKSGELAVEQDRFDQLETLLADKELEIRELEAQVEELTWQNRKTA